MVSTPLSTSHQWTMAWYTSVFNWWPGCYARIVVSVFSRDTPLHASSQHGAGILAQDAELYEGNIPRVAQIAQTFGQVARLGSGRE